jgi:glycogen synthase
MKKKVVLLGPSPPPYGGVSIYTSTLFHFLKDRGLHLWTYGDREVSGPNVHYLHAKGSQLVPLVLREGRGARIADCTHFLVEYPSLLVPLWLILKRLLGFEWLKIIHDGSLPARYQQFNFLRRMLFRRSLSGIDEFVTVNEELRAWLLDEMHVRQEVVMIKSLFPPRQSETNLTPAVEKSLVSFLSGSQRISSIGVFIPDYGFAHIAEAVERLREESARDIRLLLLDGDFVVDEAYRSQVLQNRTWITVLQNVPHPQVFSILKKCDVFVRGFGRESLGLSRIEALWCGLPVVATRAGEIRGMLTYDFGNVAELVVQLRYALAGDRAVETTDWAKLYSEEAEENLKQISAKLGLDS